MVDIKDEIKTIDDLRQVLLEEITKLRAGKTTPAAINAITNATGKVFTSVKLEIEYRKMLGQKPVIPYLEAGK